MMRRGALLAAFVLLVAGCAPGAPTAGRPSPSPAQSSVSSPSPAAIEPSPSPAAGASPSPAASPAPRPQVDCSGDNTAGHPLLLVAGAAQAKLIYDVQDPLRPRLLCRVGRSGPVVLVSATAFDYLDESSGSQTLVVRQVFGGGGTALGSLPVTSYRLAWRTDGAFAYLVNHPAADGSCCGVTDEHLVRNGSDRTVCTYQVPIVGIGPVRFFMQQLFDYSADGRYFVTTSLHGKGGTSCDLVFNAADGSIAAHLPDGVTSGFWAPVGARLFITTGGGTESWTPEGGFAKVTDAAWIQPAGSPDGRYAAYTYYRDQQQAQLRAGVFDLGAGRALTLPDSPRSEPGFVSSSLVWYLEEGACNDPNVCYWPTVPDGRVLAYDLNTGQETAVTFAQGEAPVSKEDTSQFAVLGRWP